MKVTITTLLLVFSFLALTGCSKATEPQQADIAVFEQFLSENPISSVSPTVDIASIYQQGDPLFESVLYIQRNLWAEAKTQLEPMVKNQNPDAKFWLASITWGTGIKNNPMAKKLYMESAEQGNPYAALFFSPKNDICQMYYSSECSEEWVDKAQKLFVEKAKTGDVRAVYYSTVLKPDLTHEQYISAIINAAKSHYYYPLVEYSNNLRKAEDSNQEMKELAIELLNYARFNNFVPAIESLMKIEGKHKRMNGSIYKELMTQGISLGANYAWRGYRILSIEDDSLSEKEKYIAAKATELFNGDDFAISFTHPPKEKEALIVANNKAQEKADSVKRVIYIDGAHVPEG
ncbi:MULTISPECIES: hypothetical protein [unclassified Photobacterium]|uniref:hypothetical protein n=3 Tax=unclassified Photobacterium TaxID=2628852 RepID=UPI000D16AF78|nr:MULTISPECIES: hypothetical protein [unclassified Photobacterium]PSV50298.1 hypothetical protein C9J45_20775 [Photobacterium sp. GB-1]PSV51346.1 hypothetical protein C9J43_21250 [Photobacterium sp. GB-3]PSW73670.1 hypothetical protein C9J41_10700 [Photobacterium sp. GB-50]